MKKIVFLLAVFVSIQISAQDLNSMSKQASDATAVSSNSLIDGFASDQVKSLTKKLNLNESQQSQVSNLVVSQLKSDKFTKLIGGSSESDMGSSVEGQKSKIQDALYKDPAFKNGMNSILDVKQKKILNSALNVKANKY